MKSLNNFLFIALSIIFVLFLGAFMVDLTLFTFSTVDDVLFDDSNKYVGGDSVNGETKFYQSEQWFKSILFFFVKLIIIMMNVVFVLIWPILFYWLFMEKDKGLLPFFKDLLKYE